MSSRAIFQTAAMESLYYGEVSDSGIVFVRHADACRLARIYWAVTSSETWGEFASKVSSRVMREVLNDERRISFDDFCRGWMYQALGWPEPDSMEWFRDCMKAYRACDADKRYPLPGEKCWAVDACAEGSWPEMPQQLILQWCPKEILHDFGESRSSAHELPHVYFDPKHTVAILTRLNSAGFDFIRADILVRMACGHLPDSLDSEAQRSLIETAEQHRLASMIAPDE